MNKSILVVKLKNGSWIDRNILCVTDIIGVHVLVSHNLNKIVNPAHTVNLQNI